MKQNWRINAAYQIVGYNELKGEKVVRRLLELGFTPGQKFIISHKSMLGKSVIVDIRGFCLSMRSDFLKYLKVKSYG